MSEYTFFWEFVVNENKCGEVKMTNKDLVQFLKKIKRNNGIKRSEINKLIKSHENIPFSLLSLHRYTEELDHLNRPIDSSEDVFVLSDKGIDYLRENKKDFVRMWVPHFVTAFIAIISLLVSIASSCSQCG